MATWWRTRRAGPRHIDAEAARQAVLDAPGEVPRHGLPQGAVILVALGGAVVTAFGLSAIRSIVAPVLLALVLTICAHPVRTGLERRGVPRGLATTAVVVAVFVLLSAFAAALVLAFARFVALLPDYAPQLHAVGETVAGWLSDLGFSPAQVQQATSGLDPGRIESFVTGALGSVANLTFGLVVILTTLILMPMDASYLGPILGQMRRGHARAVVALESYAAGVRRYMTVTAALGAAQGLLNAVALVLLAVPGAFLWGLLSFLCSFIPNIGYFIAIVPPLVFGYLSGGLPTVVWVIVVYGAINGVVQSIVQPRVVGNAVLLGQTITFVSVLFWAAVIGPIGALLAIPLTLLVRLVLVDTDPNARWWRPALGDLSRIRENRKP